MIHLQIWSVTCFILKIHRSNNHPIEKGIEIIFWGIHYKDVESHSKRFSEVIFLPLTHFKTHLTSYILCVSA